MRKAILVLLVLLVSLDLLGQSSDFGRAQWIGALTREQARLPEGRNFTGAKLKEPAVKAAWANIHPLADRSIYLRKQVALRGKVRKAVINICGLGFYELTVNLFP